MNRSPSYLAQIAFDVVDKLHSLSNHSSSTVRLFARFANKFAKRVLNVFGRNHTVSATVYGRSLVMPSEHPLAPTLRLFPQYNRPLGLAVVAIAHSSSVDAKLAVIDVGANVGDTIALIEQRLPDTCSYLCVEADSGLAEICKTNYRNNSRVEVEQSFIGEDEGSLVRLEDDGRANPSTKLAAKTAHEGEGAHGKLVRLDTVAAPFAAAHRRLDLIKIDTEGYDFSILRSGAILLQRYKPSLYFEWFPRLLTSLQEEVWAGFDYLKAIGYSHFVFFTNQGDYYCTVTNPDQLLLRSLASVTKGFGKIEYFDVFTSISEPTCRELVELSIAASNSDASQDGR